LAQTIVESSSSVSGASGAIAQTSVSCPAGYTMTGGGSRVDGELPSENVVLNDSYPVNANTFQGRAIQTAFGTQGWTLVVSAICTKPA
jgi:hypothetical protein